MFWLCYSFVHCCHDLISFDTVCKDAVDVLPGSVTTLDVFAEARDGVDLDVCSLICLSEDVPLDCLIGCIEEGHGILMKCSVNDVRQRLCQCPAVWMTLNGRFCVVQTKECLHTMCLLMASFANWFHQQLQFLSIFIRLVF